MADMSFLGLPGTEELQLFGFCFARSWSSTPQGIYCSLKIQIFLSSWILTPLT